MRKGVLFTCVALGSLALFAPRSQSQQPNAVKDYMRAKLTHSQKVLEGLTTEDFEMIAKNARAMSLLSQATNWQVLQTSEYLQQSREFQRAADALAEAADKKNLDGAALAYVGLTLKCVNCHKYVRGVRNAAAEPAAGDKLGR